MSDDDLRKRVEELELARQRLPWLVLAYMAAAAGAGLLGWAWGSR